MSFFFRCLKGPVDWFRSNFRDLYYSNPGRDIC